LEARRYYCQPSHADWNAHLKRLAESGLTYLGTIHTHDGAVHEEGPSTGDNQSALETGERIFAIDCILPSGRRKHTVKFWYPQSPVSIAIE